MIPHAYALIPDGPGRFRAVHLAGVTAAEVNPLEPNGQAEGAGTGLSRIATAMMVRHRRRAWGV